MHISATSIWECLSKSTKKSEPEPHKKFHITHKGDQTSQDFIKHMKMLSKFDRKYQQYDVILCHLPVSVTNV